MALSSFGVSAGDVLDHLPVDKSSIGASTEPISTSDLDEWIQDATSEVAEVLRKWGLDPTDLDDDTKRIVKVAVEYSAAAEAVDAMPGAATTKVETYRSKADSKMEMLRSDDTQLDGEKSRLVDNINRDRDKPDAEFIDTRYQF